jgi:hypothetical protein
MKLFMDNMEILKKNYDQFLKSSNIPIPTASTGLMLGPAEQAIGNWKSAGEALFRSFIEQQIELCRFFGKRWERYLDFPRRLSNCKTPAEVAELEMEFLKKMAEDYSQESAKLAQPVNNLMSGWAVGRLTQ